MALPVPARPLRAIAFAAVGVALALQAVNMGLAAANAFEEVGELRWAREFRAVEADAKGTSIAPRDQSATDGIIQTLDAVGTSILVAGIFALAWAGVLSLGERAGPRILAAFGVAALGLLVLGPLRGVTLWALGVPLGRAGAFAGGMAGAAVACAVAATAVSACRSRVPAVAAVLAGIVGVGSLVLATGPPAASAESAALARGVALTVSWLSAAMYAGAFGAAAVSEMTEGRPTKWSWWRPTAVG